MAQRRPLKSLTADQEAFKQAGAGDLVYYVNPIVKP
jgi:hypothetical protein